MPINTTQIEEKPLLLGSQASPPTTGSGRGAFFALDVGAGQTEAAFVDEAGNVTQLTEGGALNFGSIDHGNLAGLGDDDHAQYHNNTRGDVRYFQKTEFLNVSAGAGDSDKPVKLNASGLIDASMLPAGAGVQVKDEGVSILNPATALNFLGAGVTAVDGGGGQIDITIPGGGGGGALNDLSDVELDTPQSGDVLQFDGDDWVNAPSPSSALEYTFTLAAGANMATRIAGASGVPAGWTLAAADTAGVAQMGATAETLVISHGATKFAQEITIFELTTSGPAVAQGYAKIDLTSPGVQKSTTDLNHCGVIGLQPLTDSGKELRVFVKLIG